MSCITVTTGNVNPSLKARVGGISATASVSAESAFRFSAEPTGGVSVSVVYIPIVTTASVDRVEASATKANNSIKASAESTETLKVSVEDIVSAFSVSANPEESASVSVGCNPITVRTSLVCTTSVSESVEMWWCDGWKVLWDNGIKALWRKGSR